MFERLCVLFLSVVQVSREIHPGAFQSVWLAFCLPFTLPLGTDEYSAVDIPYNSSLCTLSHRNGGICCSCILIDFLVCKAWMSPFLIETRFLSALPFYGPLLLCHSHGSRLIRGRLSGGAVHIFLRTCLVEFSGCHDFIADNNQTHGFQTRENTIEMDGKDRECWFNSCWRRCYITWDD